MDDEQWLVTYCVGEICLGLTVSNSGNCYGVNEHMMLSPNAVDFCTLTQGRPLEQLSFLGQQNTLYFCFAVRK